MQMLSLLKRVAIGSATGVAAVTALPIFGAVGAITAVGVTIGALVGASAGVIDEAAEGRKNKD